MRPTTPIAIAPAALADMLTTHVCATTQRFFKGLSDSAELGAAPERSRQHDLGIAGRRRPQIG